MQLPKCGYLLKRAMIGGLLFLGGIAVFRAIEANEKLLDQDGQPVANAWVVATREECQGLMHCNTFCVEVKVAKTDERGRYAISSGFRSPADYRLSAYRDGYVPTYRQAGSRGLELVMEKGGRDSRFAQLDPVSSRITHLAKTANEIACPSAPLEQRSVLIPLYVAMFREANSLARFPEQHQTAKKICQEMFWTQRLPGATALTSDEERDQQERFLRDIEPACNVPIDDSKEKEILSAILGNDLDAIRHMAQDSFDFNRLVDGHHPAILIAATKGSAEMVAELAKDGAKADAAGDDGRTALDIVLTDLAAERTRRLKVARALLEGGADANHADVWGFPPLVRIASEVPADIELFKLLLQHGARISQAVSCQSCGDRGTTVLHRARDPALLRLAIAHGANVNAQTPSGDTPLFSSQTPEATKALLDNGADPNVVANNGWTPLMYVVQQYALDFPGPTKERHREIAELLVRGGARLNIRNQQQADVFSYTSDEGFKERLRTLAKQKQASF